MAIPMYLRHIGERPSSASGESSSANGGWTGHYNSWDDESSSSGSRPSSSGRSSHENLRNKSPISVSLETPEAFPNLNIIYSNDRDNAVVVPSVLESEANSKSPDLNNYFSNSEVFPQHGLQDDQEELQLVYHSKTLAGLGMSGDVVKSIVNLRPGQFEWSDEDLETLNRGVDAISRTSQSGKEVELNNDPDDEDRDIMDVNLRDYSGMPSRTVYDGSAPAQTEGLITEAGYTMRESNSARISGAPSTESERKFDKKALKLSHDQEAGIPTHNDMPPVDGSSPLLSEDGYVLIDDGHGDDTITVDYPISSQASSNSDEIPWSATAALLATPQSFSHEIKHSSKTSLNDRPRFIVGIDYGTTFTGVAYACPVPDEDGTENPGMQRELPLKTLFENASQTAYYKLLSAASHRSAHFRRFVEDIGSHDDLVRRGFSALERLLHHERITSLADVYSFLHVAYAISQTEVATPARSTPVEFRHGLDVMRNCLSTNPLDDYDTDTMDEHGSPDRYSERNLFDEIVEVMWNEIDYAVAWIGKRTQWSSYCNTMGARMERLQLVRDAMETSTLDWPLYLSIVDSGGGQHGMDLDDVSGHQDLNMNLIDENRHLVTMDVDTSDLRFSGPLDRDRTLISRIDAPTDPPGSGSSSWLDIVTGSIFLIVIGFLQVIQDTDEPFYDVASTPYSFLFQQDPFVEPDTHISPEFSDYRAKTNSNFAEAIQQQLSPTAMNSKTTQLLNAAVNLVSDGVITTLRSFENYVLGLLRLCNKSMSRFENLEFAEQIVRCCWGISTQIVDAPWRVKLKREEDYSFEYVKKKIFEVDEVFSQTIPENRPLFHKGDPPSVASNTLECLLVHTDIYSTPPLTPDSLATADSGSVQAPSTPPTSLATNDSPMSVSITLPSEPRPICEVCGKPFSTSPNLYRHRRVFHPKIGKRKVYYCHYQDCEHKSTRKDNVDKHRRLKHGLKVGKKKDGVHVV